jgi:hypothetical protein
VPEIIDETAHTDAIHNSGIDAGTMAFRRGFTAVARFWGKLHVRAKSLAEQVAESWRSRDASALLIVTAQYVPDEQDPSMSIEMSTR